MSDLSDASEKIHEFSVSMMHNSSVLRDRADELLVKAWRVYSRTAEANDDYAGKGTYISALVSLSRELTDRADWEEGRARRAG